MFCSICTSLSHTHVHAAKQLTKHTACFLLSIDNTIPDCHIEFISPEEMRRKAELEIREQSSRVGLLFGSKNTVQFLVNPIVGVLTNRQVQFHPACYSELLLVVGCPILKIREHLHSINHGYYKVSLLTIKSPVETHHLVPKMLVVTGKPCHNNILSQNQPTFFNRIGFSIPMFSGFIILIVSILGKFIIILCNCPC